MKVEATRMKRSRKRGAEKNKSGRQRQEKKRSKKSSAEA